MQNSADSYQMALSGASQPGLILISRLNIGFSKPNVKNVFVFSLFNHLKKDRFLAEGKDTISVIKFTVPEWGTYCFWCRSLWRLHPLFCALSSEPVDGF